MKVIIGGYCWLDANALKEHQKVNLRRDLTIHPRRTSMMRKEPPKPIELYKEDFKNNLFGVPRQFYDNLKSSNNNEILRVSNGTPMSDVLLAGSNYRSDGPFVEQASVIDKFIGITKSKDYGGFILNAGCAFGKALRHGEPVLTEFGFMPIEDVKVGDKAAGTNGKFYNVTGVYPQGIRKIYRVRFTDGSHVDCDEDHLWTVESEWHGYERFTFPTWELTKYMIALEPCGFFLKKNFNVLRLPPVDGIDGVDNFRAISSVDYICDDHATCISVGSPDRLFLTRNYIPTHNTFTAIEFARRLGVSNLILVNKEFFIDQWSKSILELCPEARIGVIQQDRCDFIDKDFVIGMCQSLSRPDKYPKEIYSAFGLVTTDEVHRIAAHSFAPIIPMFNAAWKIGLSATPDRLDGAENVFFWHIGEIAYSAKPNNMVPRIRRIVTDSTIKGISRGSYKVKSANLSSAQICSQLASDKFRTKQIAEDIIEGVIAGKKILVVSERLASLKDMAELLSAMLMRYDLDFVPVIDYYTGEWFTGEVYEKTIRSKTTGKIRHKKGELKRATRKQSDLDKAARANVVMASLQICVDGDSIVVDTNTGVPFKVRDLCDADDVRSISLLSYDEDGKFRPNKIVKCWKTGEEDVLRFVCGRGGTRSIKSLSVTGEHLVMTQRGWIKAKDVVVGDWFMAPGGYEFDYVSDLSVDDAWLLGHFIGDGCVSQMDVGQAGFYNIDDDIVENIDSLLCKHDASLKFKEHGKYDVRHGGKKGAGVKSSFRRLIELHGLNGCRAWEKVMSDDMLFCNRESAGALIAGLINTDGCVGKKRLEVSHSSSSMVLSYQIQQVLLRYGILSFVFSNPGGKGRMDQWLVKVSGISWVKKLRDLIGDYLSPKKKGFIDGLCKLSRKEDGAFLRVPEEHWLHAMRVLRASGQMKKDVIGSTNVLVGGNVHRNGAHKSLLKRVSDSTDNELLRKMASDYVLWERVTSIENIGKKDVYDLTMENSPNFVCNGFVVHNCSEGLNIPALDIGVFITPISDPEQPSGRIMRWCEPDEPERKKCKNYCPWRWKTCNGKRWSMIVDVVDKDVPQAVKKWKKRLSFYKSIGAIE